ncbi:hypothetical protein GCM10007298_13750 [Williamsia phyllosphaerae]|uniref:Uncharacterized protein n=2 Tax=Williamsia phyllosphaerae TaxID=885042 RepID=A0ABQ1UJM5_9NOCA|nr:hypothetical protein GCM10007298_13750 [Williamsia phyllosphaerae]
MVDRICSNVGITRAGTPFVTAEEEYEWAAQIDETGGDAHDAIRHLASTIGLKVVPDIRPIKFRKLLLMNGSQLGYSVLAHKRGHDYLSEYHSARPRALKVLMQDLLSAVENSQFEYDDELKQKFDWYYDRILASMSTGADGKGDTTARMMSKASTESAGDYLRDVADKLGDAVTILRTRYSADVVDKKLIKRSYDAARSIEF